MKKILFVLASILTCISARVCAEEPEPVESSSPQVTPYAQIELTINHAFTRIDNLRIGVYGTYLPSINFAEGLSPTVLVGPSLSYKKTETALLGGFIINNPHIIAPLIGVRLHTEISLSRSSHHESHPNASTVPASSEEPFHPHLIFTALGLFDPQYGWTENDLDISIAPVQRVEIGVRTMVEGYMLSPSRMRYYAGPSLQFELVKASSGSRKLSFDIAYLAGTCEGSICHGPFFRLEFMQY